MKQLKCPSCESEMKQIKDPDVTIDRCEKCGGIFLDKGELDILATGMAGEIEFCSIDDEAHKDKFIDRNCPNCPDHKMRKINLLIYSDTIFDFCPNCEGFFLDKDELKEMNLELEELTKEKGPEEYRGLKDNYLVRLDKIKGVVIGGYGPFTNPEEIFFLRISVYFKNPLGVGLRMYYEKWSDKISKLIGLFKGQDLQVGDEDLDPLFIIQGKEEQKIKALLSSEPLKKELLDFVSNRPKMLIKPGKLEIIDKRIILTEGPYTGSDSYDVEKDPCNVVERVIKLALLFEQYIEKN